MMADARTLTRQIADAIAGELAHRTAEINAEATLLREVSFVVKLAREGGGVHVVIFGKICGRENPLTATNGRR